MNQEIFMVLALIISTLVINIFMLIGILAAAYVGWKELVSAQKEGAVLKKDAAEKSAQIIASSEKEALSLRENARKKADQILSAAESEALNVIQKSSLLGAAFQESLKTEFKKVLEGQISAYKTAVQSFETKSEEAITEMEGTAKGNIKKSLEKFEKSLEEDEKQEHKEIEQELKKHRDQKIAEMDEYMKKTLSETLLRAVGDALTEEQHETLVLGALKKLKEINFFQHA